VKRGVLSIDDLFMSPTPAADYFRCGCCGRSASAVLVERDVTRNVTWAQVFCHGTDERIELHDGDELPIRVFVADH